MKKVVHPLQPCVHDRRLGWTTFYLVLTLLILLISLPGCQGGGTTVNLAFLGDVMPGRGVVLTNASLSYLDEALQSADLALANLESPLTTEPPGTSGGYNLCAAPDNAQVLAQSGLDMLSIVNNHSLDCGSQGHLDTFSALKSNDLVAIDETGTTTTIHDLKLTFFAYEDISKPLDLADATHSIQAARSKGSIVIVSIHWGMEYQGGASERQREIAKQFAEAGASVIWGHHPHVLQPAEWIPAECAESQDKTDCSLVLFSLGNALFDQAGLPDTRRSALVSVVLGQNGVISTQVTPFTIDTVHSLITAADKSTSDLILSRLKLP